MKFRGKLFDIAGAILVKQVAKMEDDSLTNLIGIAGFVPTFRSRFIAISKLRLNFSRVKRKLGTRVLMKRLVRT